MKYYYEQKKSKRIYFTTIYVDRSDKSGEYEYSYYE